MGDKNERREKIDNKDKEGRQGEAKASNTDGEKAEKRRRSASRSSALKDGEDSGIMTSRRSSSRRRSESKGKESKSSNDDQKSRSLSKSRISSEGPERSSSSRSLSTRSKSSRKSLSKSVSCSTIPTHSRSSKNSLSKSGSISSLSAGSARNSKRSLSKNGSSKSLSRAGSKSSFSRSGSSKTLSRAGSKSSLSKSGSSKTLSNNLKETLRMSLTDSSKIRCSLCNKAEAAMTGSCQHKFCARCFMNVVYKPLEYPIDNSGKSGSPKIGRCPKCRCQVKKDQVRLCKDPTVTPRLASADHHRRVKDSSIGGKVFVPKDKNPTFCFDEDQPFMDLKEVKDADEESWILNDGSLVPDRVAFEDGCFFDEESRTFHGKIKWPAAIRGAYQWDVVLAFKEDCNVMHVGVIHERKERVLDEAFFRDATESEIVRLQYPLDGFWKLTWKNANKEEQIRKVIVQNNEFQHGSNLCYLDMSDPLQVCYRWPGDDSITANVASGVNLIHRPKGPEIGEVISWKTKHPNFPYGFTWERLTFGEMPVQASLHFGVGSKEYVRRDSKMKGEGIEDFESCSDTEELSCDSGLSPSESNSSIHGGYSIAERVREAQKRALRMSLYVYQIIAEESSTQGGLPIDEDLK